MWKVLRGRRFWTILILVLLVMSVAGYFAGNAYAQTEFDVAQQAMQEEKYEDAYQHLQHCLWVFWWRGQKVTLLQARLERIFGHFDRAEALLRGCLSRSKEPSESLKFEILLFDAEVGSSVGYFIPGEGALWKLAVEDNHPDAPQIYRVLSGGYMKQHRATPAISALDRWLKLKPDSSDALERRAIVKDWLKDPVGAEADFRASLELGPKRDSARFGLVLLLLRLNRDPAEIEDHLSTLLQHQPKHVPYLLAMSRCQLLKADFPESRTLLNQVLQADPINGSALQLMSDLEFQAGNPQGAETWARKAIKFGVKDSSVYNVLALALRQQEDPEKNKEADEWDKKKAQARLDEIRISQLLGGELEQSKYAPAKMIELGTILLRGISPEGGLQWIYEALKHDPDNQRAHEELAKYFADKDPEKSKYHAEKAKLASQ